MVHSITITITLTMTHDHNIMWLLLAAAGRRRPCMAILAIMAGHHGHRNDV